MNDEQRCEYCHSPACEDIGGGVHIRRVEDAVGKPWGLLELHRCPSPDGNGTVIHVGAVPFDTPLNRAREIAVWHVAQAEPLTLDPSIASKCGKKHGFIRGGRWVPA